MEQSNVNDGSPVSAPAGATLTQRVMQDVLRRIASRELAPGARLPSIRVLADSLGISRSTVVEAYDRLAAEGAIQPRRGSGFYVHAPAAPLSLAQVGPRLDREIDPLWVSRQSLEAGAQSAKPGCGWLPPDWLPQDSLRRALRAAARGRDAALADYAPPQGQAPLRQVLSRRLAEHDIAAAPDQILLVDSGTQALDLLCRFLLMPGDTVLVDDPCYFNFLALLRAHRVRVVGVPYTPNGPDLDRFAAALAEHRPRLYLTNASVHNPTGATLSPVAAHRMLMLAEQYDVTIVEDDIFADFDAAPVTRLSAFDGLERVVHVGSFSKTLSAAVRCGYLAVRRDWVDGLVDLKIATQFGSGGLSADVVCRMLQDGSYRRHVDGLRLRLAQAMQELESRLAPLGIRPWSRPRAGMFLWCALPDGMDSAELARAALGRQVVLAPGNVFSVTQSAGGYLRFNAAQCQDARVFEVLTQEMRRLSGGRQDVQHGVGGAA